MLNELNEEQRVLVNVVTNEYINLHIKQWRDEKEIIEKVKYIYELYKLKEPDVYIFNSPIECQEFLNEDFLHIYPRDTDDIEERIRDCRHAYERSIETLGELLAVETDKLIKDINKITHLGNVDRIKKKFVDSLCKSSFELMSKSFNALYDIKRRIDPREKELDDVLFKVSKQIKEKVDQDIIDYIKDNVTKEINVRFIYSLPVINILRDKVKEREKSKNKTLTYFSSDVDKGYSLGLIGYYDYFKRIGIIKLDKEDDAILNKFLDYIRTGIIYTIYLNRRAVVSRNPLYVLREEFSPTQIEGDARVGRINRRLNNKEGHAIEWGNGDGIHFVNGVYLGKALFKNIFVDGFNGEYSKIFKLSNVEHKAIAIQHIGYDKLLDKLNAKKLDEWITESVLNGNRAICELFEFNLDRTTFRFVKVQDHSTGKITTLGVPVMRDTDTAKGAVAWTFGRKEEDYNPTIET